jgi:hypothetical protein
MSYSEKVIGNAYVYEECERGFYRVITEDGDCSVIHLSQDDRVGDKGVLIYCSDGASYGLHRFERDNAVAINFNKMKENYLKRWNAELNI